MMSFRSRYNELEQTSANLVLRLLMIALYFNGPELDPGSGGPDSRCV